MPAIGILAGKGDLPRLIAQDQHAKSGCLVIDFEGNEVDWATPFPHLTARFEQPEAIFAAMKDAGCDRVVMAGGIERPALDITQADAAFQAIAPQLMAAMAQGDDAALSVVMQMFEAAGFQVLGAHDVLNDLVVAEGVLGAIQPTDTAAADAAQATRILTALGPLDVGQGCVVANGLCLGIETLPGTDALLSFVAQTRTGAGGLLMKAPKIGQDTRADMPAIGPDTVKRAADAKLDGIVIQANKVLVLNREKTIEAADDAGLFLWARA